MSFANLSALMWLLPLAGIIIILYLLKMRRKDMKVPATFLWPPMIYEIRANALFQKLKFSWLLVLQLLALLLVVFALARPQLRQKGLGGDVTVLVMDTSASMSATDVGPSRFDAAMRVARSVIDSAKPGDRVSLVEAGPTPRVIFPLSGDIAKMRRGLDSLNPTHGESDVGEALRLASSIAAKQGSSRIILLSDGVFPEIPNFAPGDAEVVFQKFGESGQNVAVNALGVAPTPGGREVYCGLKNFGANDVSGVLKLFADGKLFNSLKITVKGNNTRGVTTPAPKGAKVFEARLELRDLLDADNYAVTVDDVGAQIKVLLVGQGNMFLERALALDPRVVLDRSDTLPSSGQWDVVVFDGVTEKPVKAKGVITFGAAGASSPVRVTGNTKGPEYVSAEDHPIMNGVDLEGTYVGDSQKVVAKPEGRVLATSKQGPLIVASEGPTRRIYVSFEPMQSDFPLQIGFPIFLANALDFLVPRETLNTAISIAAGRPFSLPALDETKPLNLKGPSGERQIEASGGTYVVRDIREVGQYELRIGDEKPRPVYAALRSEVESNVDPIGRLVLGQGEVAAAKDVLRLGDYWRPLLLLALLVLAGEWWLFARRS